MKKIKERLVAGFLGLACMLFVLGAPAMSIHTYAAAGRMILGLSSSSLTIGEEVTVTITAYDTEGTSTTAQMRVVYDSGVLEYTGSEAQSASGAGGEVTATGNSIKFRFKAVAEGRASVVAYGTTDEGELTAGGVRISVAAAQQAPEDPQQPEEPTPDDTDTGEGNEDGDEQPTATPEFEIDGVTYEVSSDFGAELINLGFEQAEVQVQSATVAGLNYPGTDWMVLFLVSKEDDTVNGYYLYDEETGTVCPYLGYGIGEKQQDSDSELESLQDKNATLSERYDELKKTNRRMMMGMIIAGVAILLILINVLIFRSINRRGEEDEFEEEEENDRYNERDVIEKQGAYLEATASNSENSEPVSEDDFAAEVAAIMKEEKTQAPARQQSKETEGQKSGTPDTTTDDDSLEIIDLEDL